MNNIDDSASYEEQLAYVPMHYHALLLITRPLVITEDTPLSFREEEISRSGFGISPKPAGWRHKFTMRRGEIIRSDLSGHLKFRIYLGMS